MANKGCFTKASTGILFGETLCSAEGKLPGAAFKAIEGQWHRLPLSCFCRDTSFRISASGLALSLEVGRLLRFSCLLCITISHPDFSERCLTGATCRNLTRSRRRRLFADLEMVNRGRIHKERFAWLESCSCMPVRHVFQGFTGHLQDSKLNRASPQKGRCHVATGTGGTGNAGEVGVLQL